MKIGFIGLGQMGAPMAANLLKAGHEVVVFDLVATALERLRALGADSAPSPAALAGSGVAAVITMLPSSSHARSVYLGEDGLLAGARKPLLLVDSSTIDPYTTRDLASAASERGHAMLDAPVSGGTAGAEAATLTFMVGGDSADFDRARPILTAMGRNIVHCGPVGTGEVAKLCNNLLLAISMIGVAEAMNLGAALGMEPKLLAGIFNTSTGRCWSSEQCNPWPGVMEGVPAARDYAGGFAADLMAKDLGLAADAARQAGAPLLLGAQAQQLYLLQHARGDGRRDFSGVLRLYREP